MKFIAQPQISEEEVSLVSAAIRNGQFVEGKNAKALENNFAKLIGAKHAICAVNGTAALQLALEGMNISPGAEVITPAFTFIASANVVDRIVIPNVNDKLRITFFIKFPPFIHKQ